MTATQTPTNSSMWWLDEPDEDDTHDSDGDCQIELPRCWQSGCDYAGTDLYVGHIQHGDLAHAAVLCAMHSEALATPPVPLYIALDAAVAIASVTGDIIEMSAEHARGEHDHHGAIN